LKLSIGISKEQSTLKRRFRISSGVRFSDDVTTKGDEAAIFKTVAGDEVVILKTIILLRKKNQKKMLLF
jgi:hypothetical protein